VRAELLRSDLELWLIHCAGKRSNRSDCHRGCDAG
jgi:hypothetical protein